MKASLEMQDLANAQYLGRALLQTCGDEDHFVHFYEDESALSSLVAEYLAAGLRVGEPGIAFITDEHRPALCAELTRLGIDVDAMRACGKLSLFDADETLAKFMAGPMPNSESFYRVIEAALERVIAQSDGGRVRAYGEMVDVLFRDGKSRAALRVEELWTELQRTHSFSLLCAYALGRVCRDANELHRVCAAHGKVLGLAGDASATRVELVTAEREHAQRRTALLSGLAGAVSRGTELAPILETAFDALREAIGAERSAVLLLGPDERLGFRAWRGLSDVYRGSAPLHLPWAPSACGSQPVLVSDVDCDRMMAPYLPGFRAERIAAVTTLPLLAGERPLGQLALYYDRPHATRPAELEFAQAVADMVASAVTRFSCRAELDANIEFSRLFASILGQDLRNQLAPIMMGAQLAADRADSDAMLRPLATVLKSGERMVRMIDQLLDFTDLRVGTGVPLAVTRVDVVGVLRQVIDELDDANPEWLLSLEELGGDTEGSWDCDRLSQVFFNLVTNAVEHGNSAHGVQVRVDGRDRRAVCIEVHNRGVIPVALVPKLFEPLSGSDRSHGLGLGLHITREIVRAHCGQVELHSSDTGGTMFRVSLPRDVLPLTSALPHEFFAQN